MHGKEKKSSQRECVEDRERLSPSVRWLVESNEDGGQEQCGTPGSLTHLLSHRETAPTSAALCS